MENINLFVSIAPLHIKNFERIISNNSIIGKNILLNPGNFFYNQNLWDEVILNEEIDLRVPGSGILKKILFQIKKLSFYKKYIAYSNKILQNKAITIYYCNLEDVLNNYYFFNVNVKERILVEDGILNYYDYKISIKRYPLFVIKQLICILLRIKYKIVYGQLSGIDMKIVNKQYISFPQFVIYPEKAIKLSSTEIDFQPQENTFLFIGQDILEDLLGKKEYIEILEGLLIKIKNYLNKDTILIYKPHRNGDYKLAVSKIENIIGNNYKLILNNHPIENLISDIRPVKIFSFFSTALMNLKLMIVNKEVKIYSMPVSNTNKRIISLYEEIGIINLEFKK